jgi:hypothetical protein
MMEVEETDDVAEWLGNLVKGEEDPTAASYPESPHLTRATAMEWFAKPENSRWKSNKRSKIQQDFDTMDALWKKITGMKIQKQGDSPALREEICNVCQSTLNLNKTDKAITAPEARKLRQLTREKLRPHLQNLVLSFDELTPWIDNFLRVYMPRGVFHWKNRLRQQRSSSLGPDDEPNSKSKKVSGAGTTPPKTKRKAEGSDMQKSPAKRIRSRTMEQRILPTPPREPPPFLQREIEISHERTSEYTIAATAALIAPIDLPNAVASPSHLSFNLLQQVIIREGGEFAGVGEGFEIWDPVENTLITNDFQLRNAIGLQWVTIIHTKDQLMFKLVIRPRDRNKGGVLSQGT